MHLPFVTQNTVCKAIDLLKNTNGYDSVVVGDYKRQYTWDEGMPAYGNGRIPNSDDLPATQVEAMSLYVINGKTAREKSEGSATTLISCR